MRKLISAVLCVAAMLSLSGCLHLLSEIVVDKDGSGTAELFLAASPSVIAALKEMQELNAGGQNEMDMPLFDEIDKEDLEKAGKGHGVKVVHFEKKMESERETLRMKLEFKDLKGLSFVLGDVMGDGPGDGFGIFDAGDGNLVLRSTEYDFPDAPAEEEEEEDYTSSGEAMTPEKMQKQMEVAGKLMAAISELDVTFKVTVPGEVVESNAPTVEDRTSIWAINASNMMSQQGDLEPEITFSGKGLKIKPLQIRSPRPAAAPP